MNKPENEAEVVSLNLFADWRLEVVCPYCDDAQRWEGRNTQDCGECMQRFRVRIACDDTPALCARAIFNGGYLSEEEIAATIRKFFNHPANASVEALGFSECCSSGECERCGKTADLYFGNTNYWDSREGDYWCGKCVLEMHLQNEKDYAKADS